VRFILLRTPVAIAKSRLKSFPFTAPLTAIEWSASFAKQNPLVYDTARRISSR
jgi:hypothetical protein